MGSDFRRDDGSDVMAVPYAEVIGDPIAHSKSPLIHKFWLEKLRLVCDYRRCHVRAEQLAGYIAERRADPAWRGCNVTMPHKMAVRAFVDSLEEAIREVEAVNTVVRGGDGQLFGANTDIVGVSAPLGRFPFRPGWSRTEAGSETHYGIASIVGAGGAARAAAQGVMAAGYIPSFFNRTVARAEELSDIFRGHPDNGFALDRLVGPYTKLPHYPGYSGTPDQRRYSHHVILNASAMGMAGNPPLPIDLAGYPPDTIVFEMVYVPLETPLLRQARALGLRTIDGLEMLVAQAAAAFELFFGAPAPRQHDAELRALLAA